MNPASSAPWLVAHFRPTALFSLKLSFATSSVGKTTPVPTPYAIKMALIDVAFRVGHSESEANELMHRLRETELRISPPKRAVVTNTFVKVRQEPKAPTPEEPYGSSIAYRELVHHDGTWRWAFDIAEQDDSFVQLLTGLLPHVSYIGKRGSFIQFSGIERLSGLDGSFTQALDGNEPWAISARAQLLTLDDFGPEADLDVLSSFSKAKRVVRGRHRKFVETIIPLETVSTGPGFTEYQLPD